MCEMTGARGGILSCGLAAGQRIKMCGEAVKLAVLNHRSFEIKSEF